MAASIVPTSAATFAERLSVARCVAYLKNSLISTSQRWFTPEGHGSRPVDSTNGATRVNGDYDDHRLERARRVPRQPCAGAAAVAPTGPPPRSAAAAPRAETRSM